MANPLTGKPERTFHSAFFSASRVRGYTHKLYRYPARFAPEFVRACIDEFTEPGDVVLDPFLGGGTSAVEALASGRRFVGFDLNPLAILLTKAKTTPLSRPDRDALREWVAASFRAAEERGQRSRSDDGRLRNAPEALVAAFGAAVDRAGDLAEGRRQDAARALLLGIGQWAVDGRKEPLPADALALGARDALQGLLDGLDELARSAKSEGLRPSALPGRSTLRASPAADAARQRGLNRLAGRTRLVVTSPPYPGVHVLYHRWQVRGRTETPMAYWLADLQDGLGPKHYTMGGRRTVAGEESYFSQTVEIWSALRRLLRDDAVVIQLVAFARPAEQLPRYLASMEAAGYKRATDLEPGDPRRVPNRRWYNRVEPARGWGREVLLAHRPSR
jgi:hypothetical protein